MRILPFSILPFILAAYPAQAQTATPEKAQDIAAMLSAFTGKDAFTKGILSVKPEGSSYRIDLDLRKIAEGIPAVKVNRIDPLSVLTAPQPDGTWAVQSTGLPPIDIEVAAKEGPTSFSLSTQDYAFKGVYDPKIGALTSGGDAFSTMHLIQKDPKSDTDATYSKWATTITGHASANDTTDNQIHGSIGSFTETISIKETEDNKPFQISLSSGAVAFDSSANALKNRAFLDLWSFFIAHPSKEDISRDQAELKSKLLAALPLWNAVDGKATVGDIVIGVPDIGQAKIKTLAETAHLSGISSSARIGLSLAFDGIDVPNILGAAEAQDLYPTAFSLDVDVSHIDLDHLVRDFIAKADFSKDNIFNDGSEAELKAIVASYEPQITLKPTRIQSKIYDITASGDVLVSQGKPNGTITLKAAHFDQTVKQLTTLAKSVPSMASANLYLALAAGLAKKNPDGTAVWAIGISPEGVTVNGKKVN